MLFLPCLFTACRQEQLSLPVAHADEEQTKLLADADIQSPPEEIYRSQPGDNCYLFMLRRPKDQRATGVQARLKQFDQMAASLDSRTFSVQLVGDHANIISLQFPMVWPQTQDYSDRVSAVVENYFSAPEVEDYLCNSGFAEVRLTAKGVNDHRFHPIWTASVTSEGLMKTMADGQPLQVDGPLSLP